MSWWRGLRWSLSWVFVPLVAACTYAAAVSEKEHFGDYRLVGLSQAWVSLVVSAPLMAAWAAWDVGRLRRWLGQRFGPAQQMRAVIRVLGGGVALAVVGACVVVVLVAGTPTSLLAGFTLAAGAISLVMGSAWGAALGAVLPRVIASPIALVTGYAVMAIAISDPSRRIARVVLPGVTAPCCSSTEQIRASALATVSTMAVLVILPSIFVIAMASRGRRDGITALLTATVLAIAGAWGLAHLSGNTASTARTTKTVCTATGGQQVCVWPEHRDNLEEVAGFLRGAHQKLNSAGISLPPRWSEKPTPGSITFLWRRDLTLSEHRYALAVDLAHATGCTTVESEERATAHLGRFLGMTRGELAERSPSTAAAVKELDGLPADQVHARLRSVLTGCGS